MAPLARLLVAFVAVGLVLASPASAGPLDDARRAVADARAAADATAARLSDAQSRYEVLGDELVRLEAEITAKEEAIDELRVLAARRALAAYKGQGVDIVSLDDVLDDARRDALLDRAQGHENDAIDELAALRSDLDAQRAELHRRRDEQAAVLVELRAERETLAARLADAERAQRELEERIARERAAAAEAERAAAARRRTNTGAAVGGRVVVNPGGGSFVCPVQGAIAFTNDWGQPRSGGRSHQGTDIMGAFGLPNVAVVSGSVTHQSGGNAGISVYLNGDDGITYAYFHLQEVVGPPRRVAQGEVVGHLGASGNARGGSPHTHFEIRPGGGGAVNPYPTLAAYC